MNAPAPAPAPALAPALALVLVVVAFAAPVQAHEDLASAFGDVSPSRILSQLLEPAVQYVIDSCNLGWSTAWDYPIGSRNRFVVWGHVSDTRRFCVLTRARWAEFGQYGDATYALVSADSGLLWTRDGTTVAPPVISDQGTAALFQRGAPSSEWFHSPVELVLIGSSGDTLFTRSWPTHIRRGLQRRALAEAYAFTPDGSRFIVTMNVAASDTVHTYEYNNTVLHCIDLTQGSEHTENLGAFGVGALEVADDGAVVHGNWRDVLRLFATYEAGHYSITWPSWELVKSVVDTVTSNPLVR